MVSTVKRWGTNDCRTNIRRSHTRRRGRDGMAMSLSGRRPAGRWFWLAGSQIGMPPGMAGVHPVEGLSQR